MLDIGWSELLVVAVVAIVVVGPKDLPKRMRTFGFYAGKIRRAAGDFRRQFEDAMAESEADEVRKNIEAIRANMGTTDDFTAPTDKPLMMPVAEPARTALGAPPRWCGALRSCSPSCSLWSRFWPAQSCAWGALGAVGCRAAVRRVRCAQARRPASSAACRWAR